MTSYEGLYLSTNRSDEGREVLRTSAATVSEGMLANTADTGSLEYNTVDGTLWFLHAIDRHVVADRRRRPRGELAPVVEQIVAAPRRRHALRDRRRPGRRAPATGRRGLGADVDGRTHRRRARHAAGRQARRGERALDPWTRGRRPPRAEPRLARSAGRPSPTRREPRSWHASCGRTATGSTTWSTGPAATTPPFGPTSSLRCRFPTRPSTATATPRAPSSTCAPGAADAARPSLARHRAIPRYKPYHRGGPAERDAAYHQGTVWPWLIGPYLDAARRVGLSTTATARAASRRISATGVWARSRRRPTAPRRTPPPAVLSRPGRSPRSCASAARPRLPHPTAVTRHRTAVSRLRPLASTPARRCRFAGGRGRG